VQVVVIYFLFFPMHFTKYLVCIKYMCDTWIWFCYETLFFNHDVMVCIWLAISNPHVLHVGSVCLAWKILLELSVLWGFSYLGTQWRLFRLCEAVEMGLLRLCEAVVKDWFECCTFSPMWSSREGKDVSPYFGSLWV